VLAAHPSYDRFAASFSRKGRRQQQIGAQLRTI